MKFALDVFCLKLNSVSRILLNKDVDLAMQVGFIISSIEFVSEVFLMKLDEVTGDYVPCYAYKYYDYDYCKEYLEYERSLHEKASD